ncbi:hypothetical protein [Eubacterium barkeri]|uniref:SnoaL-like domain-containing protein n=1 Tax=Eubacterium barkeri TaxID=1528 RepID=A0A1H3I6K8_EUBBA|nr:hypothetical protein [Eubacterium barkeri]SDY23272.1 hypothetical protein SAMN04488579_12133 [Eubacterium barkeri]
MKALLEYALALDGQDAQAIADLFADPCYFSDGALRRTGAPDMEARTPGEVARVFTGIFNQYDASVTIKQMLPHAMTYTVTLSGEDYPCVGCATLDPMGLIEEYIIRPL